MWFYECEYATMTISRMHPQLKKKYMGQTCCDLNVLVSKTLHIDLFIKQKISFILYISNKYFVSHF